MTDTISASEPAGPQSQAPAPAPRRIGTIGSPSSTSELTVDVSDEAINDQLLGDMVYMTHALDSNEHLLALGTVGEIETRNRWHEDPNMKGVLRVHGTLPNLSADGDVRTAKVAIQAVYRVDSPHAPFGAPPVEDGGAMGMSPTTGGPVCIVDEGLVQGLVARHSDDVVYLGRIYHNPVRLPMFVRHFADRRTNGAYHVGIFGRNGSGKTALAAHWMAMQLRHPEMSMLVFDPQGQFSNRALGLPLDPQEWARRFGRTVETLSLAEELRLGPDADLFAELLDQTDFWRLLTMKARNANRESAVTELAMALRAETGWNDAVADDVLRNVLQKLLDDDHAIPRIYKTKDPATKLRDIIQHHLDDATAFRVLLAEFEAVHSLFSQFKADGDRRRSIWTLIGTLLEPNGGPMPLVIVDLSSTQRRAWLGSDEVQARLIRVLTTQLRLRAEERWKSTGEPVNCSVIFDEAHRFAGTTGSDEVAALAHRLVVEVRETRKIGIGWTFITQQIKSLHPQIYSQLRIKAFGFGLTTGSDLEVLREEVGTKGALELYKSFADPETRMEGKVFPFMFVGPVSPLSFTSAPVFLEVFTDNDEFAQANAMLHQRLDSSQD